MGLRSAREATEKLSHGSRGTTHAFDRLTHVHGMFQPAEAQQVEEPAIKQRLLDFAIMQVNFCIALYRLLMSEGRRFLHELNELT